MTLRDNLSKSKRFQVDEQYRRLSQLDQMIFDFNQIFSQLESQIVTEEKKNGITDINHFAYSTLARSARTRCMNIQTSLTELFEQRKIVLDLISKAQEELLKAEKLEQRTNQQKGLKKQHQAVNSSR